MNQRDLKTARLQDLIDGNPIHLEFYQFTRLQGAVSR
jgi:hypothetical protein